MMPRTALALACLAVGFGKTSACTVLAAGRKATKDSSVLVTHSDDLEQGYDPRLCFIAAADHPAGSQRPIYYDTEAFPRHVGMDRGPCYLPKPGQALSVPIGEIPEVAHTYAYFEATYGAVNEHGLGIGEATCSGIFGANASKHDGSALLSIDALSRIAMERTTKAKDAIKLMGSLAEAHGFYGVGSFEGTAETLAVGDPDEAWIFHILPDPTGTSAIWAAQRVPDDHVAVVANMFVIREINVTDSDNFLFSRSVHTVAEAKGWWKKGKPLDFTKIYSDGEYAHKFYTGRRVWGAYRRFGIDLPDDYKDLRYDAVYPTTAKLPLTTPLLTASDLFAVHRDYYEGSKFDMTKGLAAGPWGDPDRWTNGPNPIQGNWERSIGLYRTTSTYIVQSKRTGQGSVIWFGPHASKGTVFVPIMAKSTAVPTPYVDTDPRTMSKDSAYWAHRYIFNVAKIKYSYAMQDVYTLRARLEAEGETLVAQFDNMTGDVAPERMNKFQTKHAANVLSNWWSLPDTIIEKYSDGWLNSDKALGYPNWWLAAVGYQNGPPPPPPSVPSVDTMCNDAQVGRCLAACPANGLAACATRCTGTCVESAKDAKDAAYRVIFS